MTHGPNTGVNLIKLLQVYFTCVIIVLGSKKNGYTCKSFIELTTGPLDNVNGFNLKYME